MPSPRAIIFRLGTVLLLFPLALASAVPPPPTPLGPGFDANAYTGKLKVTTFASGLNYPTGMQQYGAGILVGTTAGTYFTPANSGRLLLLTDTNNDAVADQTLDLTPSGGLPGTITSVRRAGNLVFVTSSVGTSTPRITGGPPTPGATRPPATSAATPAAEARAAAWPDQSAGRRTRQAKTLNV